MLKHSPDRLRSLFDADAALFLECGFCKGASIAPARDHLDGDHDLHVPYVSEKRALLTASRSETALLTVLVEAIVNDDARGRLHFECASCARMNRAKGATIGPLDDGEQSVYISGESPYPGGERVPLRIVPESFVCPSCEAECDPDDARTSGPDAPELGWEYYECPTCQHRTGLAEGGA